MTKLATPVMVRKFAQAMADAARAAEFGADLVEFRIDCFTEDAAAITRLVEQSPLPCIITCRPASEGGHYRGDDRRLAALFEHAVRGVRQPAYIDVELAAYQRSEDLRRTVHEIVDHPGQSSATSTGLILSAHDFDQRPADLFRKVEAMAAAPACRVIKVAWWARSLRDNLEAFEIIQQQYKPTIALCMGEMGLASRVLAGKFASLLTFATSESGNATAPGQPTLDELKNLYRWDRIRRDTAVFGVVGYPVGHSMSPVIHNAGFEAVDANAVYLPMPVAPSYEQFKATVGTWLDMPVLQFRGASVTIPHKENLLRFVKSAGGEVEPLAELIGAANTLTVRDDGSFYASNTDYGAALDAICGGLGVGRDGLRGQRIAVIGAGGVARAVVAGLAHCGATVVIYNRTLEKAEAVARRLGQSPGKVVAAKLEKLCDSCCHVYVNCTSVGMHPNAGASPLDLVVGDEGSPQRFIRGWGPGTLVFDTIYNPVRTRLLRDARAVGCSVVSGTEMFVRQAAAQFELWTHQTAPLEIFRSILHERLNADEGD